MRQPPKVKTLNILIAALGGEGGKIIIEWLGEVARLNGWISQSTYLAGVAQRTGATIYYTEMLPRSQAPTSWPVMSLFPNQSDIDIALTSEIAEAGRMLQRGFITPDRTTLVSSTHRVFDITEKINPLNGMIDDQKLRELGERYAKAFIRFDMQTIAHKHDVPISAPLLGALAGADVLPFSKESFIDVIQASEHAPEENLAAFEASFSQATGESADEPPADEATGEAQAASAVQTFIPSVWRLKPQEAQIAFQLPGARTTRGRVLLEKLRHSFPVSTHYIIYQGMAKTLEYQDYKYSAEYLEELAHILRIDQNDEGRALTNKVAGYLALWMCYEDIPRVAQLKTRPTRTQEMRAEVNLKDGQVMRTIEYFQPRTKEIQAMLPAWMHNLFFGHRLGRALLRSFIEGGRKLRTDKIRTHLLLRLLAFMRRLRRRSVGFKYEWKLIHAWLSAVKEASLTSQSLALEVAECARLVKGYSDTRERTTMQLTAIVDLIMTHKVSDAETVRSLFDAAIADDQNEAFEQLLSQFT